MNTNVKDQKVPTWKEEKKAKQLEDKWSMILMDENGGSQKTTLVIQVDVISIVLLP